ncbi:AAA family ATPase [Pedobacter riviphilus]|uniref:AAA family ATPase n=1 Tax=Pedobacter riviphilus TaxID=2766984 RepID=A0ABX6TPD2_9SPHI|nr:AAA family ATPase [Pedobacter riviphilus]QNR85080.1 AAA family ATPase [Pedobacter riviphilus]
MNRVSDVGYREENSPIIETNIPKQKPKRMTCTLGEMVARVKSEPSIPMLYSAIKEGSVGLVYGVAKTGKTIFCENLGMSIASGRDKYLGKQINAANKKVLFVSLEEFYAPRTGRNIKQLDIFSDNELQNIKSNYFVVTEHAPKALVTKADWAFLRDEIEEIKPGIVFIDSLTRVVDGQIENSDTAKDAMITLRDIANDYKVTLVIIHHSVKIDQENAMSQRDVAGSRIISQEVDFIFGINKTSDNSRYIKLISARYADDNNPNVAKFELDENLWINVTGTVKEQDLLVPRADRRKDDSTYNQVIDCVKKLLIDSELVKSGDIKDILVPAFMSEKTLYKNLEKGLERDVLDSPKKGFYCFNA